MSSSPDRSHKPPEVPLSDAPLSSEQPISASDSLPIPTQPAAEAEASAPEQPASDSPPPLVPKRPLMRPVSRPQQAASVETPPKAVVPVVVPQKPPVVPEVAPASTGNNSEPANDALLRQQPIPPPSEPKQYRAIGLVRGRYTPSEEQFTRGEMTTTDGTVVETVLLGRIMSLVKNHLDLTQDHLWVVYPRTRDIQNDLHLQIVGVWEPEKLSRNDESSEEKDAVAVSEPDAASESLSPGYDDDYFSIRGEVVFCSPDNKSVVVKIQQTPKKNSDKGKAFKLQLNGVLPSEKTLGYFWDLQVKRQERLLVVTGASVVGLVPPKKRSKDDPGDRKPFRKRMDGRGGGPGRSSRPIGAAPPPPPRREALPKPSKRSDQSSQSSQS